MNVTIRTVLPLVHAGEEITHSQHFYNTGISEPNSYGCMQSVLSRFWVSERALSIHTQKVAQNWVPCTAHCNDKNNFHLQVLPECNELLSSWKLTCSGFCLRTYQYTNLLVAFTFWTEKEPSLLRGCGERPQFFGKRG